MYNYSFSQWILFFYIYCFLGWCIESTIVSIEERRLVNRGFLRIPLLPLYGTGAITILFTTLPFKENIVVIYIVGMISATILEYLTGWVMETTLKVKYWDYSEDKFNLNGRICLVSSLFWGALSVILTLVVHKPIENIVIYMSTNVLLFIIFVVSVIFIVDFVHSIRNNIDLNKLLCEITKVKDEMSSIKEGKNGLNIKLHVRQISMLKNRLDKLNKEYEKVTNKIHELKSRVFKAYPTAKSKNFNEALKEIREKLRNKVE